MSAIDRAYSVVGCAFAIFAAILVAGSQAAEAHSMPVYAHEDWYIARSEPEASYKGRLARVPVAPAPGARTALRFALVADGEATMIYAPGPAPALEHLVDRNVVIEGKLVDLGGEGLGKELWVGAIRRGDE